MDEIMKRAIIFVKGRVQKVGYRDLVAEIANSMDICGVVENLPDGRVKIIAEGEEETLKKFMKEIEAKGEPMIKVTGMEVKWTKPTNEFEYFDVKHDDFQQEAFERIGIAAVYLRSINKKQDMMLEKQDMMLEKQDQMLEKQDMMLEKQDMMLEKQDMMLAKQDENTSVLREFRDETMERFDRLDAKYGKIADHMDKILDLLTEMVNKK